MANNDLLQRTLAHIEAHPEQWNQREWACRIDCGTAYCFAGTAVMLAHPDAEPEFEGYKTTGFVTIGDNDAEHIPGLARELLGLTDYQADRLFEANNDLAELQRMVRNLIAGGTLCVDPDDEDES